jgi:transposase InsO family protein
MSRRGDGWDNAAVESFFATVKRELVAEVSWSTQAEAETDLGGIPRWLVQHSPAALDPGLSQPGCL